jgi:methylmalonyl-CoA mutase N-terminal domain/subunit
VAVQTLAAVLGGTQSLHTNSRDEAHALPSEESVRIALRTQQIIAHESGVADTVDPLAGSYYVEYMTDRIEQEVHEYLAKIDGMGGMVKAIEKGYVQKEIQDAAYRYQREVESGERLVVGVNSYKSEEQKMTGLHKVDPEIRELQTGKLEETKGSRDEAAVGRSLESLRSAAGDEQVNLMPPIIEAVKNYATLGEICGVLREEFGEYRDSMIF